MGEQPHDWRLKTRWALDVLFYYQYCLYPGELQTFADLRTKESLTWYEVEALKGIYENAITRLSKRGDNIDKKRIIEGRKETIGSGSDRFRKVRYYRRNNKSSFGEKFLY